MLHDALRWLAAEVAATARRESCAGSGVTLQICFAGFETHTRQHKLSGSAQDERVILWEALRLFLRGKLPQSQCDSSVWVSATGKKPSRFKPIFSSKPINKNKDDRLLETLDRVSDQFGKGAL